MTARTNSEIRFRDNPPADEIGEDYIAFLHLLAQPTWITVKGRDSSRRRAIITLLHGNEPSGLKAVHRFLRSGQRPAVDTIIFIAAVDAALEPPLFSHRFLPGERDLNRCFGAPRDTAQGRLTARLLELLAEAAPEMVIDIHNTSSHSVPFVVAYRNRPEVWNLSRHLTDKLVVLSRRLGTLVEQEIGEIPIVTLEVGGILDGGADELAWRSLATLVSTDDLFAPVDAPILLLPDPLRLELTAGHSIAYGATASEEHDVTLPTTIDQLNFSCILEDTTLGWLGERGMAALSARDQHMGERVHELFHEREGVLLSRRRMTLFMITTDSHIATNDCILYLVPVAHDPVAHDPVAHDPVAHDPVGRGRIA